MLAWFQSNYIIIALIISEILPLIPGVESNSIGQLVINALKSIVGEKKA